jgi:hypothetical protein
MKKQQDPASMAVAALKAQHKAELAALKVIQQSQLEHLKASFAPVKKTRTSYRGFAVKKPEKAPPKYRGFSAPKSGLLARAPAKPRHDVYRGFTR